ARNDLTAFVLVGKVGGKWQVRPYFWTPQQGLEDRVKRDRAPYDLYVRQGHLRATPGATVDYEAVAAEIAEIAGEGDLQSIAFDRWRVDLLQQELDRIGASLPAVPVGHGLRAMSPPS